MRHQQTFRELDALRTYGWPSKANSLLWIAMAFTICGSTSVVNAQAIASFSDGSGKHVFYLAENGSFQESSCAIGNNCSYSTGWTSNTVPSTPQPMILTSLTGFSDAAGEHLFFEDWGNQINHLYFNGSWVSSPLNVTTVGYPTGHSQNGFERLLYLSLDQHIHLLSSTVQAQEASGGSSWTDLDLTARTNAPLAHQYSGFSSLSGGAAGLWGAVYGNGPRLFYVGTDTHVYQLWDEPIYVWHCGLKTGCYATVTYNWVYQDLTLAATVGVVPDPASTAGFTSFSAADGLHVVYIGVDGHICQFRSSGSSWVYLDLSNNTGTAGGAQWLASDVDSIGDHVFYLGTDQHIHQLLYNGSWSNTDLTNVPGALPVWNCFGRSITSFSDSGGQSVFYVGMDAKIHRLFNTAGGPWGDQPLPGIMPYDYCIQ